MKLTPIAIALLAATAAHANVDTTTLTGVSLYKGSKKLGSYADLNACTAAARALPPATYKCEAAYRVVISPDPVLPPSITAQPSAVSVQVGAAASFAVAFTGTAPISIQWLKDGAPIAGATSATYAIASTTLEHAGTYIARLGNAGGSVTSNPAVLAVTPVPCPAQPPNETITNICPAPAEGTWDQTIAYAAAPSPQCWTKGSPTPATAPDGACVTPPPVPPTEPPPDMSGTMVYVDMAKLPTPAVGYSDLRVAATTEVAPLSDGGSFRTTCTMSHMAKDDPIVFPGIPGASHLHVFFGNTGANAFSTAESLSTTGNSTCRGGIANRSAYWVSAMIDTKDGTPLVPTSIGTYYKNGKIESALIQPIPEGLRMIAGDPTMKGPNPAGTYAARFKCIGGPNNQNALYGSAIGNCDAGAELWSEVFFPQCWNGVDLDKPDHRSHMSYTVTVKGADGVSRRQCPSSHPVALPEVTFNIIYAVTEKDAPLRWRLASDMYDKSMPGGYSSHGDLMFGWRKDISDAWGKSCVQARKDCHSHLLGDGRKIF